jgi:transposase
MPPRRRPPVTDRFFREHPTFFRARDLLQVKYEMLRAHGIDARAVRAVCQAFGFSRQSFYTLRARFRVDGLQGLLPRAPGRLGPTKCTPNVMTFLREAKAQDPTLSGATLAARVEERFGVRLHRRTVERLLDLRRRRPKKG